MYKVRANNKYSFNIQPGRNGFEINGEAVEVDLVLISNGMFHILYKNRSYLADVVEVNRTEKYCAIKINGNVYRIDIQDKFDELLHKLGMDSMSSNKINDIKAPMPGLVLSVLVKEGDVVKKGDNLFILEAMKMENIIKSPADVTVKSVKAKSGDKVEKNQPIILFG